MENYKRKKCIHGKRKEYCREGCGGNAFCIHGKRKEHCKEGCGGSAICIHGKLKDRCKEGCGGSFYCKHGSRKTRCKEGCGGSEYCEHGKLKRMCKDGCGGQIYCKHGKDKTRCKEGCGGSFYCEHGKDKTRCKEGCGGSSYCEHNKLKQCCIICLPNKSCIECKNILVNKRSNCYPFCQACFCNKYPDHEKSTLYKIKERYLRDELRIQFPNNDINMIFDKKVEDGCSLRRPDVLIDCLTHSIVIECDEEQHKNYKCEERRTNELYLDLGDRPLIIIRFNPDRYINYNEEKVEGCFKPLINIEDIHKKKFYDINQTEWKRRIDILVNEIKKYLQLDTFPNKMYTEVKLFYDEK